MQNILYKLDDKNPLFSKVVDTEGVIGLSRDDLK